MSATRIPTREFDIRTPAGGLCYEAAEAARRIAQGSTETGSRGSEGFRTLSLTSIEHYCLTVRDDLENPIRSERMFKASLFAGPRSSRSFSSSSFRAASTGL